jgi:hypothetical protein
MAFAVAGRTPTTVSVAIGHSWPLDGTSGTTPDTVSVPTAEATDLVVAGVTPEAVSVLIEAAAAVLLVGTTPADVSTPMLLTIR